MDTLWDVIKRGSIEFIQAIFPRPEEVKTLPMNQPIDPPQAAQNAPSATQTPQPTVSRFPEFCALIKTYEGANTANNNPYDEKYYFGGYLPKYGVVKESPGGFAMFESLALGELYGETCITEMIDHHPEWNFFQFFSVYAPANDKNDPVLYANTIAKQMGTVATTNLKTFLGL